MKKNYFYSALLAFLLSGGLSAPMAMAQVRGEKHRTQLQLSRFLDNKPAASLKLMEEMPEKAKVMRLKTAPAAPRLLGEKTGELARVDTLLMDRVTYFQNNELAYKMLFKYDDYGYRNVVALDMPGYQPMPYEHYSYTIGPANYWTVREVEGMANTGWKVKSKEERDINSNRQLMGRKVYRLNANESGLVHHMDFKYDYSHKIFHEMENIWTVGALVEYNEYDNYGDMIYTSTFDWEDFYGDYIMTNMEYYERGNDGNLIPVEKHVLSRNDDTYVLAEYEMNSVDSSLYLAREVVQYKDNGRGYYERRYNESGKVSESYGSFELDEKNVPSMGYTTTVSYEMDRKTGDPLAVSRLIKKGLDDEMHATPGIPFYRKTEHMKDGEWETREEFYGEWINDVLSKIHYVSAYDDDTDLYVLYSEQNGKMRPFRIVSYDPQSKTYSWETSELKEDGKSVVGYKTFFNLKNEVLKTFRMERQVDRSLGWNISSLPVVSEKQGNGKWQLCKHWEFREDEDGSLSRYEYDFNEKGMPLYTKVWETIDGKEYLSETDTCEVTPTGYKIKARLYDLETSLEGNSYFISVEEQKWVSAKEHVYSYLEYSPFMDLNWGERMRIIPDVCFSEVYDHAYKDFVTRSVDVNPIVSEDKETGFVTTISRNWDGEKIVYDTKNIRKPDSNPYFKHDENYDWNKEEQRWVGRDFQKSEEVIYQLDLKYPIDQMEYDDTGKNLQQPVDVSSEDGLFRKRQMSHVDYVWDDVKKEWIFGVGSVCELIKRNDSTYVEKVLKKDYYNSEAETNILVVDDEGYVVSISRELVSTDFSSNEYRASEMYVYERNEQGYMTKANVIKEDSNDNKSNVGVEISYVPAQILPTAINKVTSREGITVKGRNVVVADGAQIEVFDLGGRKLMSGKGEVTLPAAGLYLVKSAGVSMKVCCK